MPKTEYSLNNIVIAIENEKVIGILLYFENDCKLPEAVNKHINVNKEQAEDFDGVIQEYFAPLLSKIENTSIYINNLCVDIEARRQGVAGKLVDYLKQTFPDRKIILDCLEENTTAVNFYLKFGFKITEHFLGFTGKEQEEIGCIKLEYRR